MTFGSNELIYVPGSPLPIMIEEFEDEDEDVDTSVAPSVPPRTKVARTPSMTQPEWFDSDPTPLPSITVTEDEGPPPEIKPRLKNKIKHYKSAPLAFVDPEPELTLAASVQLDDIKAPETLPRTRRGQNKNKVVENIVDPCVNISPPPRMYATIPRKRKIDPNPVCVS